MTTRKIIFNSLLFLLVVSFSSISISQDVKSDIPLVISDDTSYIFGPYLSYVEDEKGEYSIDQIREMQAKGSPEIEPYFEEVFNLGLSQSVYWLFVRLEFDEILIDKNSHWYLEIENPLMQTGDLYIYHEDKLLTHQQKTDTERYQEGGFDDRYLVFDIFHQGYQQVDLIFRLDSQVLSIFPLTLWKVEGLANKNRNLEYWLGFYFGLMAVMALYNIVIYFVVKDSSYIYYVAYIVSLMIFFLSFSGSGRGYLFDDISFWNDYVPVCSGLLALAFMIKSSCAYIGLAKISQKLQRAVTYLSLLLIIVALFSFVNTYNVIVAVVFSMPWIAAGLFYIALFSRWNGSSEANILLASLLVLFISILIFIASISNIIPHSLVGKLSLYFGSAIHVVLFSIGLANQINIERRKRYQALIGENQAVQKMRNVEERSLEKAMLDPLTSLPNRAALERFNSELLDIKNGKREPIAVAFIHVHGYHEVSHILGFRSSDLLIERISTRLNRIASELDDCISLQLPGGGANFVAKVDSASFVLLFRMKGEKQIYINHIEHLLALLKRPVAVHDMMFDINAKAGLSFSPEHSTNIFTLVRFAQAAAESQAEIESSKVVLYSNIVSLQGERKLKLINDLRDAIKNDDLSLVFQPQLNIRQRKIVSLEALVRWNHSEFGEIGPSEFVVLAEKTGLIDDLSTWVIHNAVESLVWLLERGLKLRLAINISAKNLLQEGFTEMLVDLLDKYKLKSNILSLEITETSLMLSPEKSIKVLRTLHELGFVIAIDDFGAGYSSLAYIKRLPLSEIKIDRSFVSQIDSDHSDRVITKSTISMAHEMGALVCAEGVESASCLKILEQFDCDIAQGFHIAKPLTKEDLVAWIDESQFVTW